MTCIILWNNDDADASPYGTRVNRYRPSGVMKAVMSFDSSVNGIWLYAELMSIVVYIYAFLSVISISLMFGSG